MYCKILLKAIKEAKRNNYNSQILESNNKIKTTLEIVKVESGKKTINEDVQVLNICGKSTNNPQSIASAFNEYSLSLVKKIYLNNNNNNNNNKTIITTKLIIIQYIICRMPLTFHIQI
jgi:hypothetical protein